MRRSVLGVARGALLAGPTALAFFTGGYGAQAAQWAGLGAWVLVIVGLLATSHSSSSSSSPPSPPSPRASVGLALGGLALLAIWTLISTAWAPIRGNAYQAGQVAVLYAGALLAAVVLLRSRPTLRIVEPALAAGTLIVIGYGLSERMLPGLLHFARSVSADGRLEQPLTYWNAMGELAALGFVLCTRIAGDYSRPAWMGASAAAATAPLGLGLYLSFSRGALYACVAGLVVLIVAAARREQLRAVFVSAGAGVLAAAAVSQLQGVTSLQGGAGTRELQGAIALALLTAIALAAGLVQWRTRSRARPAALRLPRRAPVITVAVLLAGLTIAIVVGNQESNQQSQSLSSSSASRLVTLQSNRYAYWRVALRAFEAEPLRGVGAGGWATYWLRYRKIREGAQDAHSLPLQTAAELGVIGLALLAAFLAGVALAARTAHREVPALAAGPIAGFVVYLAHSPLDWDWQMPALTLFAMALGGMLLALVALPAPEPAISAGADFAYGGRTAAVTA